MKRITQITLFTLALVVLAGLADVVPSLRPVAELEALVEAATENVLSVDVACDCRTGTAPQGNARGDVFIIQGKMFPAGTLPTGTATNDPTQSVNGVSPIGDWICRGQGGLPFPPAIASAYASSPAVFFTQYFILKKGTITTEGYEGGPSAQSAVTGGINGFSGVSGDYVTQELGTNITGCPNFRVKFRLKHDVERGESN